MKKFGLIGHPVGHSMSAVMHAAAFRDLGLDCEYGLYDVEPGNLDSFMSKSGDFSGLNVTIPHKMEVIKYLDYTSSEAQLIGAVNTIKIEGGRKLGYNTDGIGCVRALEEENVSAEGKKVLVLGAGGAARAVVFQLALEGAHVSVSNRTRDKASLLALDVKKKTGKNVSAVEFRDRDLREALLASDIFINATSVGMHPNAGDMPVKKAMLHKGLVVMDLVYNPLETKLLSAAREAGCKTVDGAGMLVNQGAESLRIWLGVKPPIEAMRKAVKSKLS